MSARGLDYLLREPPAPAVRPVTVSWTDAVGTLTLVWHPTPFRSGWQADCWRQNSGWTCRGQFFCQADALRPMFAQCTRCGVWARCP